MAKGTQARGAVLEGQGVTRALRRYDRERDLPKLTPLWPAEIADRSVAGRARLLARLRRALRDERRRGLAGHWTYDLARHAQLAAAYRAETAELARLLGARMGPRGGARP